MKPKRLSHKMASALELVRLGMKPFKAAKIAGVTHPALYRKLSQIRKASDQPKPEDAV